MRGYTFQVARSAGPVNTALGGLGGHAPIAWGDRHSETFAERLGHTATICIIGEDLPEHRNAVTLDSDLVDSDGIPAPKVSYTLSDNSDRMLDDGIARATQALEAAGAKQIIANPLLR